ncbi:MAG: hypothetical protein ABSA16_10815 [Thermoguttaceae bacterium]
MKFPKLQKRLRMSGTGKASGTRGTGKASGTHGSGTRAKIAADKGRMRNRKRFY